MHRGSSPSGVLVVGVISFTGSVLKMAKKKQNLIWIVSSLNQFCIV